MKTSALFLILSAFTVSRVWAADIAADVQNNTQPEDGGFVELSLVTGYIDNPLVGANEYDGFAIAADVSGEYRLKRFFFEAAQTTQDGLNVGFNLHRSEKFTVDLLLSSMQKRISDRDAPGNNDYEEARKDRYLLTRESIYSGSGVRLTYHAGPYVTQYRLVTDTFAARGMQSTLRFGRGWQAKNWNFHSVVSAEYTSSKLNDYWVGVSASEATTRFPEYKPSDSIHYSLFAGVSYPLAENWVFKAFAWQVWLPEEQYNSPLFKSDSLTLFATSVNYVF